MSNFKNLVDNQVKGKTLVYRVVLDQTFEMPKEFASVKLVNEIQSKQVVTNAAGQEVCLATFRTIVFEDTDKSRVFNKVLDLNAGDKNNTYFFVETLI